MQSRTHPSSYLPHIDGLRAVAVLAVILYHLNPGWLPGGFSGVDIFFVISGFIVSASVDRLPELARGQSVLRFYARRLRRIAPALIVCLLVTGLASMLLIPESWLSETSSKTGRMAFFGLSNWVLAGTGNDYFSPKADFNPYTHTWSLGVEEQFYLLFPLLLLLWGRGLRARAGSAALLVLVCAASLGYAAIQAGQEGRAISNFYLTSMRLWQLAAGVLLYQAVTLAGLLRKAPASAAAWPWRPPLALLSLALIGYGLCYARPGHSPWPDGLWPVLGTLGFIGSSLGQSTGWAVRALSLAPVVAIGRVSYSLYLWHWPVFVVFRWTLGLDSALTQIAAVLLVAALSMGSYRFVEQPLRSSGTFSGWSHRRWVGMALVAIVLGAATHAGMARAQKHLSLSTVSRNPLDWYAYARSLKIEYPDCKVGKTTVAVNGGSAWFFQRENCKLGPAADRRVFVLGDSHALAYNEMLHRYALHDGSTVKLYNRGGCAIGGLPQVSPQCAEYERNSLADVAANARAGDVLFLPGLRIPRLAESWELFDTDQAFASVHAEPAEAARRLGEAGLVDRLKPLAEQGVLVVFEAPKPVLPAPPYRCSDWFNRHNPICRNGLVVSRDFMQRFREPVLQSLTRTASQLPHASIWDPLPVLCDENQCTGLRDGRPLFFDGDHLSGHGNRVLLEGFSAHLRAQKQSAEQSR